MVTHQQPVKTGRLQPTRQGQPRTEINGRGLHAHGDVRHATKLPAAAVPMQAIRRPANAQGLGVLAAWACGALLLGAVLLRLRDA
jgi:hypothetical protein